jgi:hypothetical protein
VVAGMGPPARKFKVMIDKEIKNGSSVCMVKSQVGVSRTLKARALSE